MKKISKVLVAFLVSIGLFSSISSETGSDLEKNKIEYIQKEDETIDGKH